MILRAGTTTVHGTHDATTSDASRAAQTGMTRCNERMKTIEFGCMHAIDCGSKHGAGA